jgi:ketosteroid isomerase-like protein
MQDPPEIEVLRRGYERVNARDFEGAVEDYHSEVEWHDPPGFPGGGIHRGKDAVKASWEAWGESWEEWHLEPREMIPSGDHVVVETTISGRGRGSGLEVDNTYFQVWTFEEGRIVSQHAFGRREDALRAAGIDPEQG